MDYPTVDFHGIELKPKGEFDNENLVSLRYKPSKAFSSLNLEEHDVLTSCGLYQRVYVQPSKSKSALITYHDIGTNHTSFLSFFNHPEMRVITQHFTVYHICAPGHHENASNVCIGDAFSTNPNQILLSQPELPRTRDSISRLSGSRGSFFDAVRRSTFFTTRARYPDLDQLADMITSILVQFGIKYFVGIGMGAGSNVLCRFALHNPDNVLALFLINPNATVHGYFQWFRNRWSDLPSLERGILTDALLDQLEAHWFGFGLVENMDVAHFYDELARSLNPYNMAGYIRSYIDRKPLMLIRSMNPPMPGSEPPLNAEPTQIKCDTCLVTGDRATELSRALADMNGLMDPKRTQFLMIPDCTGMVMEENPGKLALNFLYFLRSVGLLIHLTPEKLRQQSYLLQQSILEHLEQEELPAKLVIEPETV